MKKRVALKDIAKKVGVSIATVSYVLSKGDESGVSVEMSKKIKKVAKELNYQPNQIAKSLKSGRTFTIGLIVADISNPFFAQIARIAEDTAAKLGYTIIFGSSDENADKSWSLIQFFRNRQVDGFIIVPTEGSEEQIKYLKDQKIPFVLVDRYFSQIPTNYVATDHYKAAYKAVSRLIETGNTKIGIVAYTNPLNHMTKRIEGSFAAMNDHDLEINENWLKKLDFSNVEIETKKAIDNLLVVKNPVDAIFFTTYRLAIFGLLYIKQLGYNVPDDVAVIGFDSGEAYDFHYAPVSHVQQPLTELGRNAVKILIDQITNPDRVKKQIDLEAKLVIRKSCGSLVERQKSKVKRNHQ